MILADKITEERKKNGWSQEELHMECENHIWNILKKNALKQSMVYLE